MKPADVHDALAYAYDHLDEIEADLTAADASHDYVFVTFNVGHFVQRHTEWLARRQCHPRIVVSQQRPIGDTLRRLLHLANSLDAAAMRDRLEFLSDW